MSDQQSPVTMPLSELSLVTACRASRSDVKVVANGGAYVTGARAGTLTQKTKNTLNVKREAQTHVKNKQMYVIRHLVWTIGGQTLWAIST